MYHTDVDFTRPLEAVFPGASAAVLAVLARAQRPLTLRQIAERAGVSHPQVARHVERFETLGIVRREVVGRSHQILLVDGAIGSLISQFVRVDQLVVEQMRETACTLEPTAVSVVVFGSFARGSADARSDIDVAVIVDEPTSDEWLTLLSSWVDEMTEFSGSPIAEIVISINELADRLHEPLWGAIRSEGVTVAGRPLDQLVAGDLDAAERAAMRVKRS